MEQEQNAKHCGNPTPEGRLSFLFRRTDRQLRRCIEKKVNHTGVYQSQHRLLMHLNHHPNCSQIEIAREMEISPAAVAVSLKKLESGGYIMRETTESDSRTHRVTITKKGRSVIERSEQMFWETEKAMFEGFSEEEMQSLQQFLERIYENLLRDETLRKIYQALLVCVYTGTASDADGGSRRSAASFFYGRHH